LAAHGDIKRYQIVTALLYYIPLIAMLILFANGFAAYYSYITLGAHTIVSGMITLYFAYKNYQFAVSAFLKTVILRCSVVLLFMVLIASLPLQFMEQSFLRLICVGFLSSITYIISVWYIGFNAQDRVMFLNIFVSIWAKIKSMMTKG